VNIAVLLKQVPNTESLIEIAADKTSIKTGDLKWIINPYDEYAVEEALRIREKTGAGKVTIVTLGPERSVEAIRTALAMGADDAVLVDDPALSQIDTMGAAKVLAAALKQIPFDLVIAGCRAVDDDHHQVPAAVAEFLGLPQATMVVRQEITDGKIRCEKSIDGGTMVVEMDLPALFTAQKGLNEPRYTSLPGIMKAKKKPLNKKKLSDIGLAPEDVGKISARVIGLSVPPPRKPGKMVTGETAEEKAATLVRLLREEAEVL
jgi:electron transfer flavoprotein beta subunit